MSIVIKQADRKTDACRTYLIRKCFSDHESPDMRNERMEKVKNGIYSNKVALKNNLKLRKYHILLLKNVLYAANSSKSCP